MMSKMKESLQTHQSGLVVLCAPGVGRRAFEPQRVGNLGLS